MIWHVINVQDILVLHLQVFQLFIFLLSLLENSGEYSHLLYNNFHTLAKR